MNLISVSFIAMCVGLVSGGPATLEASKAVYSISGSCTTPAGKAGRCVSIFSCPHIANMLRKRPVPENTIAFVQSSVCKSPVEYSVCCDPSIEEETSIDCQTELTAFPPDPSSGCCGEDTVQINKIISVGGLPSPIDGHPWTVLIEYIRHRDGATKLYCGGALLSTRYVLTAAHCVAGRVLEIAKPIVVRLGEYDITHEGGDCVETPYGSQMDCTEGVTSIAIEKTIPHPEYVPAKSKKNDLALIRLKEPAPYTDFIRPICLPTKDLTRPENTPANFSLVAVGWGATETRLQSNIKLQVEVPFVSYERCQPVYNRTGVRTSLWRGQLCAGGTRGIDTCKGDSGGPLVYEENEISQLVGIVSFGPDPCGQGGAPGIYSNVYEYLDWIRSVIVS